VRPAPTLALALALALALGGAMSPALVWTRTAALASTVRGSGGRVGGVGGGGRESPCIRARLTVRKDSSRNKGMLALLFTEITATGAAVCRRNTARGVMVMTMAMSVAKPRIFQRLCGGRAHFGVRVQQSSEQRFGERVEVAGEEPRRVHWLLVLLQCGGVLCGYPAFESPVIETTQKQ
jgi:hypothetical protein